MTSQISIITWGGNDAGLHKHARGRRKRHAKVREAKTDAEMWFSDQGASCKHQEMVLSRPEQGRGKGLRMAPQEGLSVGQASINIEDSDCLQGPRQHEDDREEWGTWKLQKKVVQCQRSSETPAK